MKGNRMKTMLPIEKMENNLSENYEKLIGNLSLFSKGSQKSNSNKPTENRTEENDTSLQSSSAAICSLERPVTPIEKEIKAAPKDLLSLQRLVRRRIQLRSGFTSLTKEDQMELAGVIMSEVNYSWLDLRHQVKYPFLTESENDELNRRMVVYLVSVCAQLFDHYLAKAEVLNQRLLFSKEVNLVRLKTQLSIDTRKLLKILTVRRYILTDIKREIFYSEKSAEFLYPQSEINVENQEKHLKFNMTTTAHQGGISAHAALVKKFRPTKISHSHRFKSLEEDLADIQSRFPQLDIKSATELIRAMPWDKILQQEQQEFDSHEIAFHSQQKNNKEFNNQLLQKSSHFVIQRRRSLSVKAERHRTIFEELGIQKDDVKLKSRDTESITSEVELSQNDYFNWRHLRSTTGDNLSVKSFHQLTREDIRKDLLKMHQHWTTVLKSKEIRSNSENRETNMDDTENIPPLLQAVTGTPNLALNIRQRANRLQELDERDYQRQKEQNDFKLTKPLHPQPATITKQMGIREHTTVRISDVRPSVRVSMSRLTIGVFGPVWNDIRGEIDKEMIQKLDSCLFTGDEIREVYKEIMKTVPRDHMLYTQDPMVCECPDEVDLGSVLPSTLLYRPTKKYRVLNKDLVVVQEPPWGQEERQEWQKAPIFSAGDKKGSAILHDVSEKAHKLIQKEHKRPTIPAAKQYQLAEQQNLRLPNPVNCDLLESTNANANANNNNSANNNANLLLPPSMSRKYVLSTEEFQTGVVDIPELMQERVMRSYGAWLQWWKDWFSMDDYKKFLLTKQSDFLHHVFHLYHALLDEPMTLEEEEAADGEGFQLNSEKATRRAAHTRQLERLKEEENLKETLIQEKSAYQNGFWNPNVVLLGGLGKEPPLSDEMLHDLYERYDAVSEAEMIGEINRRSRQSFIGRRRSTRTSNSGTDSPNRINTTSPGWGGDGGGGGGSTTTSSPREKTLLSITGSTAQVLRTDVKPMGGTNIEISPEAKAIQSRWESVWSDLQMPDHQRLNLAIKYGGARMNEQEMDRVLRAWEKAAAEVIQREKILVDLENFERQASNPNRFFEPGMRGSSISRMDESRRREEFDEIIRNIEASIKKLLLNLETEHNDRLTFAGRYYLDKMKSDRTEMLYWLQEERRNRTTNSLRLAFHLPPLDRNIDL